MYRWSPLNDRQRTLLGRLDAGEGLGEQAASQRRSAYALRDRGPLLITRRRGGLLTEVTDAGKFYLKHGRHPDNPAHAEEELATPTTGTPRTAGLCTNATQSVAQYALTGSGHRRGSRRRPESACPSVPPLSRIAGAIPVPPAFAG